MPTLILCAGMHRSGSTWLYNVVRYCYLNAGCRAYAAYMSAYRPAVPADAHVVKLHAFDRKLCERADYVFTTIRDMRDIVASMIRFKRIRSTPWAVARFTQAMIDIDYTPWAPHSQLEIRYEEMIKDRPAAIAQVLAVLGLTDVDPVEVNRDIEKLSKIALADRDLTTQMWPTHLTDGRRGSYAETLSPQLIAVVERIAGRWLTEHGYPLEG